MLAVGKTLKAHGIKGEIKVSSYMDSPECFIGLKKISIENTAYSVQKCRTSGSFVYIKLNGIDTMNEAENLRDKEIFVEHSDLPVLSDGRYYITDLIGCVVSDGEKVYGKIKEVLQYGSADVIVLKNQGKTLMFPWVMSLNAKIDVASKTFQVDEEKLSEVIVYED